MTPDWPRDAARWPTTGVGKMDQPSCGRGGTSDSTRCQALWATRNCRDWMRFLTSVKQWRPNTPPDFPETLNLFSPVSKKRAGRPGSHIAFASRDGGTQPYEMKSSKPWQATKFRVPNTSHRYHKLQLGKDDVSPTPTIPLWRTRSQDEPLRCRSTPGFPAKKLTWCASRSS